MLADSVQLKSLRGKNYRHICYKIAQTRIFISPKMQPPFNSDVRAVDDSTQEQEEIEMLF
jgi:hypothetical protein